MVESIHSMPALRPLRDRRPASRPVARKPRLPHPYLAPQPKREQETISTSAAAVDVPTKEPSWTPAGIPMARPAGRTRLRHLRMSPAEKTLRNALRFGLFVNAAALLTSRFEAARIALSWNYGGEELLLTSVALLSGYALLMLGRRKAGDDR